MAEPRGPLVTLAFFLLGATALVAVGAYVFALFVGMIAVWPFGVLGLIPLTGVVILIVVVLRDQTTSKEDKYYSDNVDQ